MNYSPLIQILPLLIKEQRRTKAQLDNTTVASLTYWQTLGDLDRINNAIQAIAVLAEKGMGK
jgi:hypothetical protein